METDLKSIARRAFEEFVSYARKDRWLELVLGIERTQALAGGKWVTTTLRFTRTVGGPNVYVSIDDMGIVKVEVYWGSQSCFLVEDLGSEGRKLFDELRRMVEGE